MKRSNVDPVLIIGAGMAGLTAAQMLKRANCPLLVLDKGRGVGGRMATRRFDDARFDHGAQFFTVRNDRFRQWVAEWQAAGIVTEWSHGFAQADGISTGNVHPCYRGSNGMTAVPKYLARHLNVQVQTRVTAVSRESTHWFIHTEAGEQLRGQAIILTPPIPQSLALLDAGQVKLPDNLREDLERVTYNPCLALMALFAGPSELPNPGGLHLSQGPIAWIADNFQKGISPDGFAVTIHASADYSRRHWQTNSKEIAEALLEAASKWLNRDLVKWELQRWRYSQPTTTFHEPMLHLPGPPALVFAGDAFGGPRVEGAAISGYRAAMSLLSLLQQ